MTRRIPTVGEWSKSSYSGATTECVEVRETPRAVDVRDTKNRERGHLSFPTAEWVAFVRQVVTEAI